MEIEIPQDTQNIEEREIPKTPSRKFQKKVDVGLGENEGLDEDEGIEIAKPKKPRTEAQIASFKKALEVKRANALKRKEDMNMIAEQQRKELEKKIIKKALSIKKKEIRSRIAIESISDDDEPVESVLEKAKKAKLPKQIATPQWTFV